MRYPPPNARTAALSLGLLLACAVVGSRAGTLAGAPPSGPGPSAGGAPATTQPTPGLVFGARQRAVAHGPELERAWTAFGRGDLARAEKSFRQVSAAPRVPEPDLVQALFGTGLCREYHRPLADGSGATQCFTQIVRNHPRSEVAPWAIIELGNLVNDKSKPKQTAARKFYRDVLEQYPQSPAAHEAALRLADSLFFDLTPAEMKEGANVLKRHLREHPDNPLATIMLYRLDYFYGEVLLDYEAALPYAIEVATRKLNDPFRWSRQYWHVAEILRLRLGRVKESAAWYRKIVEECPESNQALAAEQILREIEGAPGKGTP